jgi:hypothetical protein
MFLTKYNKKKYYDNINEKYEFLYSHYLNGKNIALVGPAKSLLNFNYGEIIDNFDLTVRLNKSLPLQKKYNKHVGSKTHILYNSLNTTDFPGENNIHIDFLKENNLNFVCCSYPLIQPFDYDIYKFIHHSKYQLPFKYYNEKLHYYNCNLMKTRPFTGINAICDLLQYNIKSLFITGIDFYNSNYYKKSIRKNEKTLNYNKKNAIHNSNNQIKYLKYLSLMDDRIILDQTLDQLLYQNYYQLLYDFKYYLPIKNKNIAFLGIYFNQHFYNLDYSLYDYVISFQYLENVPNLIYIDLKNENFDSIGFHNNHKYKISKFGIKKLNQLLLHSLNIKNFNLELYILFLLLCNQITIFNINLNINQNTNLFMRFLIKKNILHIPTNL